MQEITIQGQSMVGTFLRVELGRKNIIACNRCGKARAVVHLAGNVARIRRAGVKTMDEIEIGSVRYSRP